MRTKSRYSGEHAIAWLFAIAAIGLGVIGALIAYNVIDPRTLNDGTVSGGLGSRTQDFQDAALLLLPAIVMAFLAFTMHGAERTYVAPGESVPNRRWRTEHGLSFVMALAATGFAVGGIVVGFDLFDNGWVWTDGIVLQMLAISGAFLTAMLHSVGHVATAPIDDDIRVIVEDRVSQTLQRAGSSVSSTAPERRAG